MDLFTLSASLELDSSKFNQAAQDAVSIAGDIANLMERRLLLCVNWQTEPEKPETRLTNNHNNSAFPVRRIRNGNTFSARAAAVSITLELISKT